MGPKNNTTSRTGIEPSMHRRRLGFTLVELLTVIFIIGLLVSILMPSISQVRTMGKVTITKTTMDAVKKGLEMFQNDTTVGGDYPPSSWKTADGAPPTAGAGPWYGAQTLLWGMMGSDRRGTPGFDITSDPNYNTLGTLYTGTHARSGPFLDPGNTPTKKPAELIPPITSGLDPNEPVVADGFGMAILYFKANAVELRGSNPNKTYTKADNVAFLSTTRDPIAASDAAFEKFVQDVAAGDPYLPNCKDSYILISAGADGKYGTADDVTNYKLKPGNY